MPKTAIDLTNKKFGKLTVIGRDYVTQQMKKSKPMWFCKCECGNELSIEGKYLSNGTRTHCGCNKRTRLHDLTGKRFGKLLVLHRDLQTQHDKNNPKPFWYCLCDCGKNVSVRANHLRLGLTSSCGCLVRDSGKKRLMEYLNDKPEHEKLRLMRDTNQNISDEYRLIPLTMDIFAKVDIDSYKILRNYTWKLDGSGYACTAVLTDGKLANISMSNMIMNPPEGMCVNVIEKGNHDYRKSNLRIASRQEIVFSRKVSSTKKYSKYKGVSKRKGRWIAIIEKDAKRYNLGTFETEIDAAREYNNKAIELFGEFAWLNDLE